MSKNGNGHHEIIAIQYVLFFIQAIANAALTNDRFLSDIINSNQIQRFIRVQQGMTMTVGNIEPLKGTISLNTEKLW